MKMRLQYAFLVLFVLIVGSCSKESLEDTNSIEAEHVVAVEQEIMALVNDHRTSMGYNALEFSALAYEYANAHTDYMIAIGSINHDGFSARASDISSKVNATAVAENVAKDYASAKEAYGNWLASPGHRKNIEGDFTHTAVSVEMDSKGKLYFTQLFYR